MRDFFDRLLVVTVRDQTIDLVLGTNTSYPPLVNPVLECLSPIACVCVCSVAGGADLKVTDENNRQYVESLVEHKLGVSISLATEAFREGLEDVLGAFVLQLFSVSDHLQSTELVAA